MTGRRRLLLLLGALCVVGLLGLLVASRTPPVRRQVLAWAETGLAQALGREVRVESVALRPWQGRLDLQGARVAHGATLAEGTLLAADSIQVRWSWTALLRRRLVLRQITLVRPSLSLPAAGPAGISAEALLSALLRLGSPEVGGWPLRLRLAHLEDGQATWTAADGRQGAVAGLQGTLRWTEGPAGVPAATAWLRATRLVLPLAGTTARLEQLHLQASGTAADIRLTLAEFETAGVRVTGTGQIQDPAGRALLDLHLGLQAPLPAVLEALGTARRVEGTLVVDGRLTGPWPQPAFQGDGRLRLADAPSTQEPFRFSLRWSDGRLALETATAPPGPEGSLQGRLTWDPGTGAYAARLSLVDVNLAGLRGLPAAAAALAGLPVQTDVRGRLTAEMDLAGQGADLATLRGQGSLRVVGLGLAGENATGRLEARLVATTSRLAVETFTLELPGGAVRGGGSLDVATGELSLPLQANLPNVASLGRSFGMPLLGGRATFQGQLLGTPASPRLQGRLTWREARVATQAFDLIQGDIAVASRTLTTPHLSLRIGKTAMVLQGSVAATGTAPLRALNPLRDLRLDLRGEVHPGRTADLVTLLPVDVEVRGAFRAAGRLAGTLQALTGEVELALENVQTWEEVWQRGEALLRLRPQGIDITRISLRRGPEQVSGEIGIAQDGALRGRLTSTTMDLARVGSLTGSHLTGRGRFHLDLQGTLRDTRTLGQVTAESLNYRDLPLGPATGSFTIQRKAVQVDLAFRQGTHRLRLDLGPPPNRSLRADLTLANADLDLLLRATEVEPVRRWPARGSGRILLRGAGTNLAASTGEAAFTSLRLRVGGESWDSQGPVRITWDGPTVSVRQLRLQSGDRAFDIRGTLASSPQTDLSVTGRLPLSALAGVVPVVTPTEGLATADIRVRGALEAPSLQGTLDIAGGGLSLAGVPAPFRQVRASLELDGDRILIRRWQSQLAQGAFRGSGEVRRQGERWSLRVTFQEEDGRAEQLLAGLYRGKGEVTGAFSLGGSLTSEGEGRDDFWRNLNGELKLVMRDGRIGRHTIVARVLSLLNLVELLELKNPELTGQGMPYQRLAGNIRIERGTARTENLVLESRAMKMNAVGRVNFADETMDLTLAVKPFQTVDSVVTKIPLAGWLLGGKEKSLLVAYFRVSGSLADPQVTPVPLKSVGRSVFGIFRRLLEIPEALTGPFENLPPQPVKPEDGKGR